MNPAHLLMKNYFNEQKTKQIIALLWIFVAATASIVFSSAWDWYFHDLVLMMINNPRNVGIIIVSVGVAIFFAKVGQGLADYIRSRAKS